MKEKKIMTLSQWLVHKTDSETYRAGKLTGWKHPKVDAEMLAAVGGLQKLLVEAHKLEADPELGKAGKIHFEWRDMGRDIRRIDFDVSMIPLLCKREGLTDSRQFQLDSIATVERWKRKAETCQWAQMYYEQLLARLLDGKKASDAENEDVFRCLNAVALQQTPVWERVFSVRVFHDSKKFQNQYKSKMITILKNYSPYYEENMGDDELLDMHNIHSYAQTLEWKGPLQYEIDETVVIDSSSQIYGMVLNSQTIEHAIPRGLSGCRRIMTIENKANYENMTYTSDTLYVFCHGYFTPKEVRFLKGILQIADSDCQYYHWGDMDYGGISIYNFIQKKVFPEIKPYKMDADTFRAAIKEGAGIPLEAETRKKLIGKDAGDLEDLKQVILETDKVIEQEWLV